MKTYTIIDKVDGTVVATGVTTCDENFQINIINEGLRDSETGESVEYADVSSFNVDEVSEFLGKDTYELKVIEETEGN